ncbi:MAG: hypothetical protein AAF399_04040 [Bacteroidota bacterium]
MKQIFAISLTFLLCSWAVLMGQNESDALRHTQSTLTGSARAMGMGGAFSAVGADLSAATLNPAGLGLYRSSVFTVSPQFNLIGNRAEYLNINEQREGATYFGLPNWGVAFNTLNYYDDGRTRSEMKKGLKSYTFAFGHNQVENYNRNVTVEGAFNDIGSISDMFAERAQGFFPSELGLMEGIAFDVFVIDTIVGEGGNVYFPAAPGNIEQSVQLQESGKRNEWFVSMAGNVSDKFYFGATLGIQSVRYRQELTFIEEDVDGLYEFYDPTSVEDNGFPPEIPMVRITFQDEFETRGTGINFKAGIIYRPVDHVRIGLSAQTPTLLSLTDEFTSTLSHIITEDDLGNEPEDSLSTDPAQFGYRLTTPFRATAGLIYQLGKMGMISADVEYVDPSRGFLSSLVTGIGNPDFYDFATENNSIAELYRPTVNVRLGGEYRLDIFRFRLGGAFYPSPLNPEAREYQDFFDLEEVNQINGGRTMLTAGAGIRQPNFFLDVSLVNQRQQDKFGPYSSEIFSPTVINQRTTNMIVSTLGFHF